MTQPPGNRDIGDQNHEDHRNMSSSSGDAIENLGGDSIRGNVTKISDRATYAGRDYNYYDMREPHCEIPVKRDRVEQHLLKAVSSEVDSRLRQSLHNKIYIELDKKQDFNQVQTPWDVELKTGKNQSEWLPNGTKIETIFDREDISGRLLILGAPGSGKTTTLLELAKVLLRRARDNPDLSVPVLLNLSSWKDDKQSISNWIAVTLKPKYGIRVDIGKNLVASGRVLPLLDGLDELASDRQEPCVNKINKFLQEWMGDLIVCSRIKEYQHYTAQLRLRNSIVLHPLRSEQIRDYLMRAQGEYLWQLIKSESDLLALAQIPLMLNIMVVSCAKLNLERWQQLVSSKKRLEYLFETYINTMLGQPRHKYPSQKQTSYWLGWLAIKLIKDNETEFLIEKIMPYWLESNIQSVIFYFMNGLFFGLMTGIIYILSIDFFYGLQAGIIVVIGLVIFGMIDVKREEKIGIELKSLKWQYKKAKKNIKELVIYLMVGQLYGIIAGVLMEELIGPLIGGLIIGLSFGLILGFEEAEIENKTIPNQSIRQSFINLIPFSALAYPPSVAFLFIIWKVQGQSFEWDKLLIDSLGFALIFGIAQSKAFIQHFALRLLLWWNGYAPWNYAKFLNYTTDRLLIQRVGGGYRFLHDLLRKHFAEHYGPQKS